MAGGTKNAIDYLWAGFVGKPVMVVSYGGQGGKLANEQVRAVLTGMGLKVCENRVELAWSKGPSASDGKPAGPGPEAMLAVFEGKLGEVSEEEWLTTKEKEVMKAFRELEGKLGEENGEQVKAQELDV